MAKRKPKKQNPMIIKVPIYIEVEKCKQEDLQELVNALGVIITKHCPSGNDLHYYLPKAFTKTRNPGLILHPLSREKALDRLRTSS
jgi:hypothetical protein